MTLPASTHANVVRSEDGPIGATVAEQVISGDAMYVF
jgi:hypothetical protein